MMVAQGRPTGLPSAGQEDRMNPYEMLTPAEWCAETDVQVMDPDGWHADGKSYGEPITYQEFVERLWTSTIMTGPKCEIFR